MRAFLKNMSHPAFGSKGEGARRAKNRRRDLGYGILFLPSLIRLGLQSWTTVWNQPLPVPGTRVPGKVPELRVPGTRVRGKVPGTQGSANKTFKQGSGNNGFWLPFGFRDVKVPGSPGSRRQEGSGHTWLSTRFREPYHGFERFWNHRKILKHPGNPEFGEREFRQGSSNTGFRQGSENHRGCGPTVWIYFLDYATGSGQGQGQSSGKVPRFRKQPKGRIYAVGCTKVHATDRVPENQFSRKPRFQDHIGPVNEQSLTGGHSVTINQRVSVPQTQGSNIRCGLCQGSGNEGSRKTRFQEHKVPGT